MVHYSIEELDRTFGALSDPTRRGILERLARGPATITQLAEPYGISLTGLKKHVQILEDAQLVTSEKRGRVRECRLGPARLDDVSRWITEWESRLDRLESVIEKRRRSRR
jgi:DNA-binding transcriptional ArsR family regulator